jgi:outer membrane protein OmpA-like peptidoglycan-associated protein
MISCSSSRGIARSLAAAALLGAAVVAAPAADAQVLHRFALRAELGAGTMLSEYQRNSDPQRFGGNRPGYDSVGLHANVRLGFTMIEPLALQVGFSNAFFPSSTQDGFGWVRAFEAGLRFEPRVGTLGRIFLDGNVGYARTGPLDRLEVNGGVGFEFQITRVFGLGPMFRITNVFQPETVTSPDLVYYDDDALYWCAGLSLVLRAPEPTPTPTPPADIIDTDCDTVPDPEDQCVTVPRGDRPDPARPGCPTPDTDNDGVLDPDDQCPRVGAGDFPDEAHRGCPDPDNDHDGVLNAQDRCPNLPAGPINDPERPGCPHPHPMAVMERNQIRIMQQVHFDNDRFAIETSDPGLTRENHEVLDQVVSLLRYHTAVELVEVQGHTDNRCTSCPEGPRVHNLELSRNRARAIRSYLVEHGIAETRLTAEGYGQASPIESNVTEAGRLANRRVQFQILRASWATPPPPQEEVRPHPLPPLPPGPAAPTTPCRRPGEARPQ